MVLTIFLLVEFFIECFKLQAFCEMEVPVSISNCRKYMLLKFPEMHVHSFVNKFYKSFIILIHYVQSRLEFNQHFN